jgi:hypothetical protein
MLATLVFLKKQDQFKMWQKLQLNFCKIKKSLVLRIIVSKIRGCNKCRYILLCLHFDEQLPFLIAELNSVP